MITSANNPKIKYVKDLSSKSKIRKAEGCFVAEGVKMFLEAPKKRIVSVFVSESLHTQLKNTKDLNKNYAALRNKLSGLEYEIVADAIYEKMSDTVTPQGVLAVVKSPEYTLSEILGGTKCSETDGGKSSISGSGISAGLYLILENLQDPGNLGTIFRTAEAAGVKGIILGEGCVDLYNPKVIRSTMGSVYRMPYIYVKNLTETMEQMRNAHVTLYAATLTAKSSPCYDKDYRKACAFLIGNESKGLSEAAVEASDEQVYIPMEGQGESLNASVAAAVLMFEAARQRKFG